MPSQPGTPGQAALTPRDAVGSQPPVEAQGGGGDLSSNPPMAPQGAEALSRHPTEVAPAALEAGVQELSISDSSRLPILPESLIPAPVTVLRSLQQSVSPHQHHPDPGQQAPLMTTAPLTATPQSTLPGMPTQQFMHTGSMHMSSPPPMSNPTFPVTQVPVSSSLAHNGGGVSSTGLPQGPPTISLPTVAPTISLGPSPNLIPSTSNA